MESLPADIIVLLLEALCRVDSTGNKAPERKVATLRAGNGLFSFILTCQRFYQIARDKFMRRVFNDLALGYSCAHPEYYKMLKVAPAKGHLFQAVSKSPELALYIISIADVEYINSECGKIEMYRINSNVMFALVRVDVQYLRKAWNCLSTRYYSLSSARNRFKMVKTLLQIRDELYPDVSLMGTSAEVYYIAMCDHDYEFVRGRLREDSREIKYYSHAVNAILTAIERSVAIKYPWLAENDPAIMLFNEIVSECKFRDEWYNELSICAAYKVYLAVKHQINLDVARMDEVTLLYYMQINIPTDNLVKIIECTPAYAPLILTLRPLSEFMLTQRFDILQLVQGSAIAAELLSNPLIEPSTAEWLFGSCFDEEIIIACFEYGIDEIGMMNIKEQVDYEAKKHRVTVNNLASDITRRVKDPEYSKWLISRSDEKWSVAKHVSDYIQKRDEIDLRERKIDEEQKKIKLNWSQENFSVPQWEDYDVMLNEEENV